MLTAETSMDCEIPLTIAFLSPTLLAGLPPSSSSFPCWLPSGFACWLLGSLPCRLFGGFLISNFELDSPVTDYLTGDESLFNYFYLRGFAMTNFAD